MADKKADLAGPGVSTYEEPHQRGHALVADGVAFAHCYMAEGDCQMGLPEARGPEEQKVLVTIYPGAFGEFA